MLASGAPLAFPGPSSASSEGEAVKSKQTLPRRLSFGSATEEPAFPMQNYLHYFQDDFENQFAFLKQLHANPGASEQALGKAQEELERLKVEFMEIATRERFLQILAESGATAKISQPDLNKRKQDYIQSELQREKESRQVDRQIKHADQVIGKICDGFDKTRREREAVRTELEDISNQQQQMAKQRTATEAPVGSRRRSSIGSMTANSQALAAWYSETTNILSRLAGIEVIGAVDTADGGVEIQIAFLADQGLSLIATFDSSLREITNMRVEPKNTTLFDEVITVALQEKWPLIDVVRYFVAGINRQIAAQQ